MITSPPASAIGAARRFLVILVTRIGWRVQRGGARLLPVGHPFRTFKLCALEILDGAVRESLCSEREIRAADAAITTICIIAIAILGASVVDFVVFDSFGV
jgi:hypothetical protein